MSDYQCAENVFHDADAAVEQAKATLAKAEPGAEGDPAWLYLTKTRKLPEAAVRGAVNSLRYLRPPIEGRPPQDHAIVSLLRDQSGEISGLQLTFCDVLGHSTATEPKRQTYSLRPNGCRDGLFHAGGGTGDRCYLVEGYAEKALAVASLGIGPAFGAGSRTTLGRALPPEADVVLVADRRPDDKVVDLKTGRTAADDHDRDYKKACDLLLIGHKRVWITPDPPCACCKDADAFLVKHGPIRLTDLIEQAQPAGLSLDGEARRLAAIADRLERDRETSSTARRLKIRVSELRDAVQRHLKGSADREAEDGAATGSAQVFEDLDPSADRQDGEQLLDDVDEALARHVFLDPADRTKALLWTVHGHRRFHGHTTVLPRMIITAPAEDSGKTTFAVALVCLSDVAEHTTEPTASILFRAIEAHKCALFLDEADAWYRKLEDIRAIINSGFTLEGASILRTEDVGQGGQRKLEPRRYSTFAPIAVIGVGLDRILPRTVISRSLTIAMRPARVGEVPEELFGNRSAVARLRELAGRIKRWVADNERALCGARPALPAGLINRLRLVWVPLLAIADAAGGAWPKRAREALEIDRCRVRDRGLGEQLLLDIHAIMMAASVKAMHTSDLIQRLREMELRTWAVYGKARVAIRDIDIAKLLVPYEVRPEQLKIGSINRNGYRLETVAAVIDRYVRPDSIDPQHPGESPYHSTFSDNPNSITEKDGREEGRGVDGKLSTSRPTTEPGRQDGPLPSTFATTDLGQEPNGEDEKSRGVDGLPLGATEHMVTRVVTRASNDPTVGYANGPETRGSSDVLICEACGGSFPKPARGRPPKRCPECRSSRKASKPGPDQPTAAEEAPPVPDTPSPEPRIKGANGDTKPELLP
jgi:hypothetical protein